MELNISPEDRALSKLQYEVSIESFNTTPPLTVLIIAFIGEYGHGHYGNEDAIFMEEVDEAARNAQGENVDAVVYDLRKLHYEWGDMIDRAIGSYLSPIVISDLNREGLTSLVEREWFGQPNEQLFETMEAAIAYLEKGFREQKFIFHSATGELKVEIFLEAGKLKIFREYRPNGVLFMEDTYYPAKVHRKGYDENGELDFEKVFEN